VQKLDMDRADLRKSNDMEIKEKYQVKFQIVLQHWKNWMVVMKWVSIQLQPQRVQGIIVGTV
jgi:hypothetical protein